MFLRYEQKGYKETILTFLEARKIRGKLLKKVKR